ncbi:hypothetical protein [Synechococcus sp. PCC 6312]|uniref:hypothetical protein n=1 Tax=Synechococcus sp. (strain ATCC 27167 / PCC 6312) TaxID=195253 RepID=UPI00029F46C5|nr:hypothetical protein [Synechococcus sp. PCC 6312]AFY59521.1 hypothetical protein Syn6312_0283 [Synechococcus sp. PCC 6312]
MAELTSKETRDKIDSLRKLAEQRAKDKGQFSIPFSLNPWLTQSEQSELSNCLNSLEWEDGPSLEDFRQQRLSQPTVMAE